MRRWVILLLAAIVLAGVWATSAISDDVEQVYEQLFGKEARSVAATSDKADDVAFARKLLDNARSVADSPRFQAYLCEKAYDFALKDVEGYPTAVEAMGVLAAAAPGRRDECEDNVLKVREMGYHNARGRDRAPAGRLLLDHLMNMGDRKMTDANADEAVALYRRASYLAVQLKSPRREEILVKGKAAVARARIEREMAELAAKLKADPNDAVAARRLLMLLLVEDDDPIRAAGLLDVVDCDEVLRTYVPLAARPADAVPEAVCIELGDWYRTLASKATPVARPRMLARAKTYYTRFVQAHADEDIRLLKARMALNKVQGELDKLLPPAPAGDAQSSAPPLPPKRDIQTTLSPPGRR